MKINILQYTNIKEGTAINLIRSYTSLAMELINSVPGKRKDATVTCYLYCSDKTKPTYVECNVKLKQ